MDGKGFLAMQAEARTCCCEVTLSGTAQSRSYTVVVLIRPYPLGPTAVLLWSPRGADSMLGDRMASVGIGQAELHHLHPKGGAQASPAARHHARRRNKRLAQAQHSLLGAAPGQGVPGGPPRPLS